ncbi:MAG: metallophosphoesterase [Oligoflexia bacterium]|nr:metallophosphoesterase [Oligoflexia bacterium]
MFFKLFAFFQLFGCFFCFPAFSETLILQSSDQHSSYKKMLNFLAVIEVLSSEFRSQYPEGKVALVINGDVSSYDRYSINSWDRGQLIYDTLSKLAKKYFVVYTFGNHDAFDWNDSQLFLDQMLLLKGGGVNLVVGNADFYPEYADLFDQQADLVNSSGKIIRFIGYTLPYGRQQNKLQKFQKRGPKIIEKIKGINMNIPLKAASKQSKVVSVVVSMHLGISKAKWLVSDLSLSAGRKLKLLFAGHDHQQEMTRIKQVHIIDSGAYFSFSAVLLDDRGEVLSKKFFDEGSQKDRADLMDTNSLEAQLIKKAKGSLLNLTNLRKKRREKAPSPLRAGSVPIQGARKQTRDYQSPCVKSFRKKRAVTAIKGFTF